MAQPNKQYHEYTGFWWTPYQPETYVTGTLSFEVGKEIVLTYYGSFPEDSSEQKATDVGDSSLQQETVLPPVIHGMAFDGLKNWHEVTLFETRYKGHNGLMFNEQVVRLQTSVRYALIGAHYDSKEGAKFFKFESHFSRIADWLSIRPYKFARTDNKSKGDDSKFIHRGPEFRFPHLPQVEISSLGANLTFDAKLNEQHNGREIHYSYSVPVKISFQVGKTLEEIIEISSNLQIFFTLLTGFPVQHITITADSSEKEFEETEEGHIVPSKKVDVYYLSTLPWANKPNPERYEPNLLTNYQQVANELSSLFNNWFENWERFGRAVAIFNANLNESNFYSNLEFLTMTQALESAHRNLFGESHFNENDLKIYDEVKKKLLDNLPQNVSEAFRQSLKSKLKYLPHDSLRRRIVNCCQRTKPATQPYLLNFDKFAEEVTESRNYFTHYTKEAEEKAAHGSKLYILNRQLEILLNALFLNELGMDMHLMERCFLGFHKYQRIADLIRQLSEKLSIDIEGS